MFSCMRRDISLDSLCDGDGVGGSGGVGVSDGTDVFRSPFLVCGGGGMFGSGFLAIGR